MKKLNPVLCAIVPMLAMAISTAPNEVHADSTGRIWSANAVSYCQTALPVFDGQVRKRPLALQNEGAGNAFVSCAFTRQDDAGPALSIEMWAQNTGANAQDLSCTLVTGFATGQNQFVTKTVTLLPGGAQGLLGWEHEDFAGDVFPNDGYSMTCNLMPGVGLNDSYLTFFEEIGA